MTSSSTQLINTLSTGVSTTCLCWKLTRADGFVVGVSEHDRPLRVAGVDYRPGTAFEQPAFSSGTGFAPGRADARGALSSEQITEEDLEAGLWDGARVDVYRVDWRDTDAAAWLWSGRLTSISSTASGFEAELVSLKADLERPVGRVFSRKCDAVLGDARCGVDTQSPEHAGSVCDHRFETCRHVFANTENSRGFPHLPGPDFVLKGPAASGNDGGPR